MSILSIKAIDIPDAWFQLLYNIPQYGKKYKIDRGSFEGCERLEYDCVSLNIIKPNSRPLIPTFPGWMNIPAPTSEEYINEYFQQLLTQDVPENTEYTYGEYITPQVYKIIDILKNTKNTNQACMNIGDVNSINLPDPPCLRVLDFNIKNDKLNMFIYFRSNDLWAGFPTNIAGFQLLKEFMASEIGCEDGEIYYFSKGLHIYDYQYAVVENRICCESISENKKIKNTNKQIYDLRDY